MALPTKPRNMELHAADIVLIKGSGETSMERMTELLADPVREAWIRWPILVYGYVPLWQMREAVRQDLTITLYTHDAAQALARTAQKLGKTVRVHVEVDSGMGRLGIRAEQVEEIIALLRE